MTDKMLEILEGIKKIDAIPEEKKLDIIRKIIIDDLGKQINKLQEKK